jgi:hypothetical protein
MPISPTQVIHKADPTMSTIPTPASPAWEEQIAQAKRDLAQRLSIDVDQIELVEVQAVVWPDRAQPRFSVEALRMLRTQTTYTPQATALRRQALRYT